MRDSSELAPASPSVDQRLRAALDGLCDGVVLYSVVRDDAGVAVDLRFDYLNPAAEACFGRPAGECLGRRLGELLPRWREELLGDLLAVAAAGRPLCAVRPLFGDTLCGRPAAEYAVEATPADDGVLLRLHALPAPASAAEALAESEARFRSVLEHMTDAAILYSLIRDEDGRPCDLRFDYLNPAAVRTHWYGAQALGRRFTEVFPALVEQGVLATYLRVVETGEPLEGEAQHRALELPTGRREGYFDIRAVPLGEGLAQFYSDVTDRVLAQQHLRQSEARFRSALDTMLDCFVLFEAVRDEHGQIIDFVYTYANRAACEYNGVPREALVGRRLLEALPGHRDELFAQYVEAVETGRPLALWSYAYRDQFAEGKPIVAHFDLRATRFGDGLSYAWRDVTDRVRAETALRESEELFRSAFDHAPLGMALLDLEGHLLRVNSVLCDLLGTAEGELLGRRYDAAAHPDDRAAWSERTGALLSGDPGSVQSEMRWVAADGQAIWVLVTRALVRDAEGRPWCVTMQVQDIGPRKLAEQELAQRQVELIRSNAELQQFAHIASHDLQEPMRKIQVLGDRLEQIAREQLGEAGRNLVGRMRGSARRMSQLLDSLMQYSRLANRPALYETVALGRVAEAVLADLAPAIARFGAQVTVGPLPAIEGDADQLHELFRALLDNALKFRREGVVPQVTITAAVADDQLELRVEDNGIGFEPQYCDRLFQPFQQLNPSAELPGTGMGLAIAQRIAQRHGGVLTASGRPGQGASFRLRLPAHLLRPS